MNHIDLFSGIGGFALAARWMGWDTVQFCEKEPFAREVLHKNFPNIPISTDIFNLKMNECTERTVLTGGFPCQPFSQAGQRKGMADARAIWPEMLRIIHEVRPNYVVAENVSGILTISDGLVFESVLLDLESEGYEVQPVIIPASGVGAYHQRERVWFVANANCSGFKPGGNGNREKQDPKHRSDIQIETHRSSAIGTTPDPTGNGRFGGRTDSDGENSYPSHRTGIQRETSGFGIFGIDTNPGSTRALQWPSQSPVCGRIDGVSGRLVRNRAKQLKGYGNAIVPQVAYEIFKALTL